MHLPLFFHPLRLFIKRVARIAVPIGKSRNFFLGGLLFSSIDLLLFLGVSHIVGKLKKEKEKRRKERKMDGAELELERRSKFLSSLIQKKKAIEQQDQTERLNVKVRASDMPLALQNKAFKCARDQLDYMPGKLDSKRLALALKKEFDSTYGPAWHCIVGTSFGSYVTHSLGGFLYFSIDKVYVLLFKTAVEPLNH
ncbi:hypothetical protein GQ457_10G027260 [Hibiscus cannabinus]